MLPTINPTTTKAWAPYNNMRMQIKQLHLRELFEKDAERFKKYSFTINDILVDFSKNIMTEETIKLLIAIGKRMPIKRRH